MTMRKNCLALILFAAGLSATAQTADPVLMTIAGKPVTRGEFEYSYNKNSNVEGAVEHKTIEEYIDMFINYKLKVLAAEEAKMDTLSSFQKEFRTYRDMQLTPYLVDSVFIDSVAHSLYDRTLKQLDGHDLLHPAHILLQVPQSATTEEKDKAKVRIDSIYQALKQGADFEETAKRFSQDPGSARNGGLLPWIGPGSVLKEFEEVAYALNTGDMSEPFLSPVGWHIVKMQERKQFEPYEQLRSQIIASLKKQGIEETSAENKIKQLVEASNGRLTREAVLDSVLNARLTETPSLKYLIQEYYDGLLLYEVSKKEVWDAAAADEAGLEAFYKKNKKKYAWTEPRFKGFVFHCKEEGQVKKAQSVLKKNADGDWKKAVKEELNKEGLQMLVTGPYLCKAGENPYVDQYIFKKGEAPKKEAHPYSGVYGKKLSQPKSWKDVKSLVVNDYQEKIEKEWVDSLRKAHTFSVDQEVAKTINKH